MLPLRPGSRISNAAVTISSVSLAIALTVTSCRCNKPESASASDAGGAVPREELDEAYEGSDGAVVDATNRFADASPRAEIAPEGPVDPACSGAEIKFSSVVVDPRCAIGSARARQLRAALERDGGPPVTLRQEARIDGEGRVVLRMVNTGVAPLTLPLSYSAKLPAFTALAEDERHAVVELEPPTFDVKEDVGARVDASSANDRAHFARIVLPPGGAAVATITIHPAVTKVLTRAPDGGESAPGRLRKGRYVLHVGELLTDVEAGPPARVTWVLP